MMRFSGSTASAIVSMLAVLVPLCCPSFGATGDVSIAIPATGPSGSPSGYFALIEVEGFTTGASYDLDGAGGGSTSVQDFSTAAIVFTVTSEGYSGSGTLGTVSRTVYGTIITRDSYPDDANLDETDTGSALRFYVALSEPIFDDDTATVTMTASTVTNTGGGSETSNALTDAAVTNSSGLDYPTTNQHFEQYAVTQHADLVADDFTVGLHAFAAYRVAAVRFTATGHTSANEVDVFVTSPTSTERTATGLSAESHKTTIDISGFTDGELIDVRARVYPVVGDTIADNQSNTATHEEIRKFNLLTVRYDTTPTVRYVRTTGNDSTGDGSTGTPYLTIGKALSDSPDTVYLGAGTYAGGSSITRVTSSTWATVTPEPGQDASTVIVQCNASTRTYRHERYRLRGVTIQQAETGSWFDGEEVGNHIRFEDCVFDDNGFVPTTSVGYRSDSCTFVNCTIASGAEPLNFASWKLSSFSSATVAYFADGCTFGQATTATILKGWYGVVCSNVSGHIGFAGDVAGTSMTSNIGGLFLCNQVLDHVETNVLQLGQSSGHPNNNWFVGGNIISRNSGSGAGIAMAADNTSTSAQDTTGIIFAHNTVYPQTNSVRMNFAYNDSGSTARNRTNWRIVGNSIGQSNIKSDTFGDDANLVGNWPLVFGAGCGSNYMQGPIFVQEFAGFNTSQGSSGSPLDPGYVDGANDDFTPDTGSALIGALDSSHKLMRFDLFGNPIGSDIGAVQTISTPSESDREREQSESLLLRFGAMDVREITPNADGSLTFEVVMLVTVKTGLELDVISVE
ncbi:hypothetical protein [Thalassoglobus neptunius]|nr:hypothetical protein [Thalassoglobus neptunius]